MNTTRFSEAPFFIVDREGKATVWDIRAGRLAETNDTLPKNIVSVAGGETHVVILDEAGQVHVWSSTGEVSSSISPPGNLRGVTRVAAGGLMSAALTDRGWTAWGPDATLVNAVRRAGSASDLALFRGGGTSVALWIDPIVE